VTIDFTFERGIEIINWWNCSELVGMCHRSY